MTPVTEHAEESNGNGQLYRDLEASSVATTRDDSGTAPPDRKELHLHFHEGTRATSPSPSKTEDEIRGSGAPSRGTSWSDLVEKYLLRGRPAFLILGMAAVMGVFLQDNAADRLNNLQDLCWTLTKSAIVVGVMLFLLLLQWVCGRCSRSPEKGS